MDTALEIAKSLGGVEDLLMDATLPTTVTQLRAGHTVSISKINWDTIPTEGAFGQAGFKSIKTYLTEAMAEKPEIHAGTAQGGLALVVGDGGGLTWDGGTPATNELTLSQRLTNGKWRWIGKTTVGSDNWVFRGKVSGVPGTGANDYITKSQLDTVASRVMQSDWNVSNSSDMAYIKNKPSIPPALNYCTTSYAGKTYAGTTAELTAGTDTQPQAWSAKQLKDFSQANSSGGGYVSGKVQHQPFSSSEPQGTKDRSHFAGGLPIDTTNGRVLYISDFEGSLRVTIKGDAQMAAKNGTAFINNADISCATKTSTVNVSKGDAIVAYYSNAQCGAGDAGIKMVKV